jgi:hypothetical protein
MLIMIWGNLHNKMVLIKEKYKSQDKKQYLNFKNEVYLLLAEKMLKAN